MERSFNGILNRSTVDNYIRFKGDKEDWRMINYLER
jgi:hypothetical protein